MKHNFFQAVNNAEGDMKTKMGSFSSSFPPIKEDSKVEAILLDVFEIALTVAAGPFWSNGEQILFCHDSIRPNMKMLEALKRLSYFADHPETVATLKDEVNTLMSFGIPILNEAKSG